MLFPSILRLPITALSNCTYTIFDNIGCCHQSTNNDNSNNILNKRILNNSNNININNNNVTNEISSPLTIEIQPTDPENAKKKDKKQKILLK